MKSTTISSPEKPGSTALPGRAAPCRIGILGCGAVSELYYAPVLQHLEAEGEAKVMAVFDPNAERAREFCAPFPKAVAYPDESFLGQAPLDLVIVASPVNSHEAETICALEAGIAVLCEKPMAGDSEAAERMIAAAHKHQRVLAVGLLRRFYANVHYTQQLIENKTLGAVKGFSIQEGGPFNWPARSDSFFRKKRACGGVLIDLGVHVLDLVLHWFGAPEKLIYADDAMGGVEANCRMELAYPAGFKGTVQLSREWQTSNLYVIEFERGTLKLRAGEAEEAVLELKDSSFVLEGPLKERAGSLAAGTGTWATSFQEAFLVQVKDLIFALRTGSTPMVSAEEGIRSLRLIEHCYQNRTLMEMPWLGPKERKAGQFLAMGGGQ